MPCLLQAKFYDWQKVREMADAGGEGKQRLINAQPLGRWSALHQAAEAFASGKCFFLASVLPCRHATNV